MGLPVAKLVVATNVNDILHRALTRGDYSAGHVTPTATPSMDIQVSSNFERMLFDLSGRDGDRKRVVCGKMVSGRGVSGGRRIIRTNTNKKNEQGRHK